jgi:hypothetical protein
MDTLTSILLGIGLSAACGFRVFVPMLFMSVAALSGHLTLGSGFQWIGTYPALLTFAVATVLEVSGYFIPWLDHLLDTMATPAAIVAGTVVTAAMVSNMSPMLKWTLAIIAGGGVAGLVQGSTVLARTASTATTGGLGNPLLATIELGGSVVTALMALIMPWVAVTLIVLCFIFFGKKLIKTVKLIPVRSEKSVPPRIQ